MYLFSMHIDIIHYVHLKHFYSGLSDVQFENKELNVVHDHLLKKKPLLERWKAIPMKEI